MKETQNKQFWPNLHFYSTISVSYGFFLFVSLFVSHYVVVVSLSLSVCLFVGSVCLFLSVSLSASAAPFFSLLLPRPLSMFSGRCHFWGSLFSVWSYLFVLLLSFLSFLSVSACVCLAFCFSFFPVSSFLVWSLIVWPVLVVHLFQVLSCLIPFFSILKFGFL